MEWFISDGEYYFNAKEVLTYLSLHLPSNCVIVIHFFLSFVLGQAVEAVAVDGKRVSDPIEW